MKQKISKIAGMALALLAVGLPLSAKVTHTTAAPDSVYLFPYASLPDAGRSGMKFAWSSDGEKWQQVAGGYAFISCDFGPWGEWKAIYNPQLMQSQTDGTWHLYWDLTADGKAKAYVSSADLIRWKPQQFFMAADKEKYAVKKCSQPSTQTIRIEGKEVKGYALKVAYSTIADLNRYGNHRAYLQSLWGERTADDAVRFAGLQPVSAQITVDESTSKPISNHLVGVFFEDLNYAADGGLYAELIQNRDFEYGAADGNRNKSWNSTYAWSTMGKASLMVGTDDPIHANNPHYALLNVEEAGTSLSNAGYDGIVVKQGEKYDFSLFARTMNGSKGGKTTVSLVSKEGKTVAQTTLSIASSAWKKQTAVLTAQADADSARLVIAPQSAGTYAFDMVSLFPQKTFKGHKNGLRADLARTIADIHPKFVRFPGGCLAHGDGVDNIYNWKESIGPLEARKPAPNIWRYHQTRGLGYFEFFQFCEDIGAEPLPVVAAGVPCQNSASAAHHSHDLVTSLGQQGGIPMEEMEQYVQDILDLIEYANGDAKKSTWGKERAKAGHPEPFHLKYLGVGNEDLISDAFVERFTMIYNAVREKYPDIVVVGTVGPFSEGTDYEEGWKLAKELNIPMVDEHNYNTPGWFIHNTDYYDKYDRSQSKVYLGEYAAHIAGRHSTIETALATALFLTSVERNADVVSMTSYAPLLAKEGHTQWNPDLIYFNNKEVKPTVDYYVQQLFGQHAGDTYITSDLQLDSSSASVKSRVGVSVVRDEVGGDMILKLVNLLPTRVEASLTIPSLKGEQRATRILLSGQPDDRIARPFTDAITVSGRFAYDLPAYSMTVIRIPKQGK